MAGCDVPVRLVAYGQDLGCVRVLLPVLRWLRRDRSFTLRVFGSDQATQVFREGLVPCTNLPAAGYRLPLTQEAARRFVRAQAPTVFLAGASHYRDPTNARLLSACRRLGVPTVALLDHWKNLDRFGERTADGFALAPDILGVMDEPTRAALEKLGFEPGRLALVGHPYLEGIYRARRHWCSRRRAERLKRLVGVPPGALLILCCSEMLHAHGPSAPCQAGCRPLFEAKDRGRTLLDRVEQVARRLQRGTGHPCVVALRPHPFEAIRAGYVQPTAVPLMDQRICSDVEAVAAADLVIGVSAMPLIQAAVLGKPVASLRLSAIPVRRSRRAAAVPWERDGAVSAVRGWSALERMAEAVIRGRWRPVAPAPSTLAVVRDAAGRAVRLIRRLARQERRRPGPGSVGPLRERLAQVG